MGCIHYSRVQQCGKLDRWSWWLGHWCGDDVVCCVHLDWCVAVRPRVRPQPRTQLLGSSRSPRPSDFGCWFYGSLFRISLVERPEGTNLYGRHRLPCFRRWLGCPGINDSNRTLTCTNWCACFPIYTGSREPSICTGSSNLFIIAPVQLVSVKPHIAANSLGVWTPHFAFKS